MHTSHIYKKGFTLIELLIVIAIIALLSGIIMTSLGAPKGKARDAKRISDLGNIQLAISLYYDRCKQYPSVLTTSASNGCPTTPSTITMASFISVIPTQTGGTAYDYAVKDASGNKVDYVLHAKLETYNEVIKDALPPSYSSASLGSGWSVVTGAAFSCTNTSPGTDYCVGSK